MSLKLWLPLNSTIADFSAGGYTVSGSYSGWTVSPVGLGASFNNVASQRLVNTSTDFNYKGENFSVALWIKKNYAAKTNSYMYAFTVGRADAGGYGYGLMVNSSSELIFRFGNKMCLVPSVPDNEWHHVAMVRDSNRIRVFRDGSMVGEYVTGSIPTYSDGGGLGIGCFHYASGDIYPLIGAVADFRIYNHALSKYEVRELSEALLLHYPLDNLNSYGTRNLLNEVQAMGELNGNFTRAELVGEPGYRFTLYYTGTGSNYYPMIYSANIRQSNFTVGKTYIWAIKYRVNRWSTGNITFRHACWSNDYTTGSSVMIASSSQVDGKWHTAYTKFTITQTVYDNASFGPRIELCCSNLKDSGIVYDFSIDLKEAQIIEADAYIGWVDNRIENSLGDGSFHNCGSYMGNSVGNAALLTRYGTLKPVPSTLYSCAPDFNQTGYLYNSSLPINLEKMTMSFWFKPRSMVSQHFMVGTFDSWPPIKGICVYRDNDYQTRLNVTFSSNGQSSYTDCGGQIITLNEWHLFTLTWDNSNIKVYIDGDLKTTKSYSGGEYQNRNLYLGNSKFSNTPASETDEGAMSDFRMYGTALSADRIQELYKVRASIDRCDTVHAYSFNYDPELRAIGRNGAFSYPEWAEHGKPINTDGASSYTPDADTTNSCSSNIIVLLNKFDTSVTNFQKRKYRMTFDVAWSGYTRGTVRYQGAINGSWSSGFTNDFVMAARNSAADINHLVTTGSSGTGHCDTEVVVTDNGSYNFYLQFRTDNSDGNATFSISNFAVYEVGSNFQENLASFRELKEV